jgi:prevent-host-death family protein
MAKKSTYSITEAKNELTRLVRSVDERPVEITRRGRTTAWIISDEDFRRLKAKTKGFAASLREIGPVEIPLGDRSVAGRNPWE